MNPMALILLLLFLGVSHTTTRFESGGQSTDGNKSKSATGVVYGVGDGQHITSCLLKTDGGSLELAATDDTSFYRFENRDRAWSLGAHWRVTYHDGGEIGLTADTVTFTGIVDNSIAEANRFARQYMQSLAQHDYRQAYEKLSISARRESNFSSFSDMYKDVSVELPGIIICSVEATKVELLLALHGSESDLFQRCEMELAARKWSITRLNRLEPTRTSCWKER
jgi:hypothetical protein